MRQNFIILYLFSVLQVASATSTFAMVFSSSMSVVQYYLLNRFPVPYGKSTNFKPEEKKKKGY